MPFHVTLMLADAAQAVAGKLYILGGGWSQTGPMPTPSAIAVYIKVPWDEANEKHKMRLELVDSDGQPVTPPGLPGEAPLVIESEFELGRPAGLKKGTPIDFSFVVNVPPLPLEPDSRFEWRLTLDNHSDEDWRLAFSTRPSGWIPPAGM